MTIEEIREAFLQETPVTFGGIDYEKVSALIYRKEGGKVVVSAEMLDKCKNSVTIASPLRITKTEVNNKCAIPD